MKFKPVHTGEPGISTYTLLRAISVAPAEDSAMPELIFIGIVGVGLFIGLVWTGALTSAAPAVPRAADPAIDSTPLPGYVSRNYFSNFSVRTLMPRDEDCLELRFGTAARLGGIVSLAAGFALGTFVFLMVDDALGPGGFDGFVLIHGAGAATLLFSGFYLLFDLGRTSFDRAAGEWTAHHLTGSVTRPLQDILAIQLISGGMQKSEDGQYETFQLNLVVHDDGAPRQNLIEHRELRGVQTMARQLADFLSIPLLDLTPLGEGATLPPPEKSAPPQNP
jgi:hypothetical protein